MKKYYCKDCGNKICYHTWLRGSKLCRTCAGILHSKKMKLKFKNERHPNFKHGCAYCVDCNNEIKYGCKRCQKCWNKFNSGKNNFWYGKPIKPRWGKYKGINMRSSWEIKYAKYLDKNKIRWSYESKTFDLGNTTYTPDFKLANNVYVEIKGYMSEIAYFKIKKFLKQYPDIKLQILMQKDLQKLGVLSHG